MSVSGHVDSVGRKSECVRLAAECKRTTTNVENQRDSSSLSLLLGMISLLVMYSNNLLGLCHLLILLKSVKPRIQLWCQPMMDFYTAESHTPQILNVEYHRGPRPISHSLFLQDTKGCFGGMCFHKCPPSPKAICRRGRQTTVTY